MITHDFTAGATLIQEVSGTGTFTGTAEIGRASASVGSGNGGLKATAWQLGSHMNGMSWRVNTPGAVSRVELDAARESGGTKVIRYTPLSGDTSEESADAFPAHCNRAYGTRDAASALAHFRVGVHYLGDGSDPPVAGSTTFAGGVAPYYVQGGPAFSVEDVDGGILCFDAPFPVVLTSFSFALAASVAWELRLARLNPDRTVAQYAVLGSGTAQRGFVTTPAVVPPGSALVFVANTTGLITANVRRQAP